MESVTSLQHSSISDVLTLARRFEPVLRYTKGELFLPMPVERYVEAAALLRRVPGQKVPEVVAPATKINLSSLISYAWEGGGTDLELNFVDKPLSRTAYRRWRRRPDRPRFQGGTRFAVVGILGRFVDSIMRFSLIVRGKYQVISQPRLIFDMRRRETWLRPTTCVLSGTRDISCCSAASSTP